jgi:UDP-N-acetylmuramoyl-L-alanyl-D-glutamate--2,6-diaminopimelate ligase
MKVFKDILYKVSLTSSIGNMEVEVGDIVFDSRKVSSDSVFVAISGTQVDGHAFIPTAIEKGAVAIVCETMPEKLQGNVTYVQVVNSSKALESWHPIISKIHLKS